ncbi:hypothetical protein E2C01_038984 [Portunus trituberculatus]|uniref:Uncharacterized protein n=1 Tax=Portunus trituberculatus TaxID=210409 RepID=A0A5B7FJE7_PORTR|nr:hypothetical protein [Portunus trituberculatus]
MGEGPRGPPGYGPLTPVPIAPPIWYCGSGKLGRTGLGPEDTILFWCCSAICFSVWAAGIMSG